MTFYLPCLLINIINNDNDDNDCDDDVILSETAALLTN